MYMDFLQEVLVAFLKLIQRKWIITYITAIQMLSSIYAQLQSTWSKWLFIT